SSGKNIGLPKHGFDLFPSQSMFEMLRLVPPSHSNVPLKGLGVRDQVLQLLNRRRVGFELHGKFTHREYSYIVAIRQDTRLRAFDKDSGSFVDWRHGSTPQAGNGIAPQR